MERDYAQLKVAVVGGGQIGAAVALLFARAGHRTCLWNRGRPGRERAFGWMREALDTLVAEGVENARSAEQALHRVVPSPDLPTAVQGAGYVFEALSEDQELKRSTFAQLDRICPAPCVLATGTSGLSVGDIAAATRHPERVLGVHHFTPAHIVPGVEVVASRATSAATVAFTVGLLRSLGRRTVVTPDIPGFIAGRLSSALRREAWAVVAEGLATAADVDAIWTASLGPIYAALGPLAVSDASGLDVLLRVHEYVEPVLHPPSSPSPLIRELVGEGRLGMKSGRGFYAWPAELGVRLRRRRDALLSRYFAASEAEPPVGLTDVAPGHPHQ